MRRAIRSLAAAATALVLAAGLASCGGSDDADTTTSASGAADTFPVSVAHKYGTTTITKEPKRIVVVGLVEQDALLSLGIVPVATTEWFGGYKGAIWPWAQDELGDRTPPTVLTNNDGLQFEKIAAQKPDLILGVYSGLTKEDYDKLSKFAPVVAQPKGGIDYGVSWQQLTTMVGTAVGRKADAEKVIKDVEGTITKAKTDNPGFAGKSVVVAAAFSGQYGAYTRGDGRVQFMEALGFQNSQQIEDLKPANFYAEVSKEKVGLLDADLTVIFALGAGAELKKDTVLNSIPSAKAGRLLIVDDADLVNGFSTNSVLSTPYVISTFVPLVQAALA